MNNNADPPPMSKHNVRNNVVRGGWAEMDTYSDKHVGLELCDFNRCPFDRIVYVIVGERQMTWRGHGSVFWFDFFSELYGPEVVRSVCLKTGIERDQAKTNSQHSLKARFS